MRLARLPVLALLALLIPVGCTQTQPADEATAPPSADPTVAARLRLPAEGPTRPRQALSLVPESAEAVVLTDYDRLRARFGVEDLTSDSLVTDRLAFWEKAGREAVLLTEGLLRSEDSLLRLDYGFTQDDVAWEARFTGDDGPGWVLAFRPGQDMAEVRRAVDDGAGPLADAEVLPARRLVVSGTAEDGEPVWGYDAGWAPLVDDTAESTYLHDGCLDVNAALGPDADVEDQQQVADLVASLEPLDGFAVGFADDLATARFEADRIDLHRRADLSAAWPTAGQPAVADGFDDLQVADPKSGRLGLFVEEPRAAAALTLTGRLPFAVCDELTPLAEPTGL
ncbi:hypothetical protein [Nocardioides donggukensis]|uniref:DUF3298 domain-containing protein n=1 Tax=Nocardioides donggukensis TaxID=2774019 RepID=A0A927K5B5_9ACTN|nr:hypothetical protein [Nocardioides donggukensis]MBD8868000.1 hypothetical protein [Nocardioides donggukensis]